VEITRKKSKGWYYEISIAGENTCLNQFRRGKCGYEKCGTNPSEMEEKNWSVFRSGVWRNSMGKATMRKKEHKFGTTP